MIDRLRDDHASAKLLGAAFPKSKELSLDPSRVCTNIVLYDVSGLGVSATEWVARMGKRGVKAGAQEGGRVRMGTHRSIEKDDVEYALRSAVAVAQEVLKEQ
jgi:threonine aldolase